MEERPNFPLTPRDTLLLYFVNENQKFPSTPIQKPLVIIIWERIALTQDVEMPRVDKYSYLHN